MGRRKKPSSPRMERKKQKNLGVGQGEVSDFAYLITTRAEGMGKTERMKRKEKWGEKEGKGDPNRNTKVAMG